jgi:hypothetical protein
LVGRIAGFQPAFRGSPNSHRADNMSAIQQTKCLRYFLSPTPSMKPSLLKAIATDTHFWVPVVVLVLGITLLVILK